MTPPPTTPPPPPPPPPPNEPVWLCVPVGAEGEGETIEGSRAYHVESTLLGALHTQRPDDWDRVAGQRALAMGGYAVAGP